jgi:predicted aspartyl protease
MITGWFGDEDELFFELELITSDGLELPVDAMFDTGFSGWLAINTLGVKARDAINRRLYNNQSFVETAIYRVFLIGDLRADTSAADSTRRSRF